MYLFTRRGNSCCSLRKHPIRSHCSIGVPWWWMIVCLFCIAIFFIAICFFAICFFAIFYIAICFWQSVFFQSADGFFDGRWTQMIMKLSLPVCWIIIYQIITIIKIEPALNLKHIIIGGKVVGYLRRAQKTKSRGPKGLHLEVGARRARDWYIKLKV